MRRSVRFSNLVIVAGIAVWLELGSPLSIVQAQARKAGPEARPGEKSPAEGESLPRVSILNLLVVKPDPALAEMPAHMRHMRRFGLHAAPEEGTTLALLIEAAQQSILSVETKDCKILKFRDDRDTDLAQAKGPAEGGNLPLHPQAGPENCTFTGEVEPTGRRATVTVHSPHLPAGGANRLSLEADLVMRIGRGERIVEQKDVNLKFDTIKVSPSPLVVMTQEPVEGMVQANGMQVMLLHQGPIQREIKKVAFIGPDGAEITMQGTGSGQSGSVHNMYYSLSRRVETCTVRLTVPERIETVTLSFTIETGVGFPPGARRRTLKTSEPRAKSIGH
jgi:hypothetical protein